MEIHILHITLKLIEVALKEKSQTAEWTVNMNSDPRGDETGETEHIADLCKIKIISISHVLLLKLNIRSCSIL